MLSFPINHSLFHLIVFSITPSVTTNKLTNWRRILFCLSAKGGLSTHDEAPFMSLYQSVWGGVTVSVSTQFPSNQFTIQKKEKKTFYKKPFDSIIQLPLLNRRTLQPLHFKVNIVVSLTTSIPRASHLFLYSKLNVFLHCLQINHSYWITLASLWKEISVPREFLVKQRLQFFVCLFLLNWFSRQITKISL